MFSFSSCYFFCVCVCVCPYSKVFCSSLWSLKSFITTAVIRNAPSFFDILNFSTFPCLPLILHAALNWNEPETMSRPPRSIFPETPLCVDQKEEAAKKTEMLLSGSFFDRPLLHATNACFTWSGVQLIEVYLFSAFLWKDSSYHQRQAVSLPGSTAWRQNWEA